MTTPHERALHTILHTTAPTEHVLISTRFGWGTWVIEVTNLRVLVTDHKSNLVLAEPHTNIDFVARYERAVHIESKNRRTNRFDMDTIDAADTVVRAINWQKPYARIGHEPSTPASIRAIDQLKEHSDVVRMVSTFNYKKKTMAITDRRILIVDDKGEEILNNPYEAIREIRRSGRTFKITYVDNTTNSIPMARHEFVEELVVCSNRLKQLIHQSGATNPPGFGHQQTSVPGTKTAPKAINKTRLNHVKKAEPENSSSGCILPLLFLLGLIAFLIYLTLYQGLWFPGSGFVKDIARSVAQTNGQPTGAEFPNGRPLDNRIIEHFIVDYTNQARRIAGLPSLRQDDRIAQIARSHSRNMVRHGYGHVVLGKNPTDRALDAGYDCLGRLPDGSRTQGLSENIAIEPRVLQWEHDIWFLIGIRNITDHHRNEEQAARGLLEAWMNSPGHRANILDAHNTRIGVGIFTKLQEEKLGLLNEEFYATQNFSGCN